MQRVLLKLSILGIILATGCASIDRWTAGKITEGIPRLRDKLPRNVKMYFADPINVRGYVLHERSRKQVQDVFTKAFGAIDVNYSTETNGCNYALHVVVENWEYGDAGFLGKGDRDSVAMAVLLRDMKTNRILTRSSLYAWNLELLVEEYVKTLFEDDKQ